MSEYLIPYDRKKKLRYKSYKKGGKYRTIKLKKNG